MKSLLEAEISLIHIRAKKEKRKVPAMSCFVRFVLFFATIGIHTKYLWGYYSLN